MRARRGTRSTARASTARSAGAGVVAAVLVAVGPREARAGEPHGARAPVHQPHEPAPAAARGGLGEGDGGVVARGQQQAVEHRVHADALPARQQPDAGAAVAQRRARDRARARPRGSRSATSSAVISLVSEAMGSTRARRPPPQHAARCRGRTAARSGAGRGSAGGRDPASPRAARRAASAPSGSPPAEDAAAAGGGADGSSPAAPTSPPPPTPSPPVAPARATGAASARRAALRRG